MTDDKRTQEAEDVARAARELISEWESHGGAGTHQECMPGCGCRMSECVKSLARVLTERE